LRAIDVNDAPVPEDERRSVDHGHVATWQGPDAVGRFAGDTALEELRQLGFAGFPRPGIGGTGNRKDGQNGKNRHAHKFSPTFNGFIDIA
jgi:hypothetical protein